MTGARAAARHALIADIKRLAVEQLERDGAAALSLRAIARELGMVSSAIYRYFPGRDELLTALIVDAYDELGATAEVAVAQVLDEPARTQWLVAGAAARSWALANPARYALIFGSPVPGYVAPSDTIGPATRVTAVLTDLLRRGIETGEIELAGGDNAAPEQDLSPSALAQMAALVQRSGLDLPPEIMVPAIGAWVQLFGLISFELFGHFNQVIDDPDAWFVHELHRQATLLHLP
jgi:AcrR family transcriptional regulator